MHSCYVQSCNPEDDVILLNKEELHHLVDVCRVQNGETVRVFDGCGKSFYAEATFDSDNRNKASFYLKLKKVVCNSAPKVKMSLIQSLPKGNTISDIVDKSVQLGIWDIYPVITNRVIKRPDKKRSDKLVERLNAISLSAAKQSSAFWLPKVHEIMSLDDFLAENGKDFDYIILASLSDKAKPIKSILKEIGDGFKGRIGIIIGPEGDFTDKEYEMMDAVSVMHAGLGDSILRVETATLYTISVIKYYFS